MEVPGTFPVIVLVLGGMAVVSWLAVLLLPSRPWSTRERIEPAGASGGLDGVSVLIPARNEVDHLPRTLRALAGQGGGLEVIVVDDQSTDATAAVAASTADSVREALQIRVVEGTELPPGWGGKLWALEQGLRRVRREWTLLLDADIELASGVVAALLDKARTDRCALVSVMATLRCETFWERLLVPPFVYFFKLIYPFAKVAIPGSRVAAAAGGCILVRTDVLHDVGAFGSIRNALIDDCTLARAVKRSGNRIWLGLSKAVFSHRHYNSLGVFSRMIMRTAFTQLGLSGALLLGVTGLMLIVFVSPFALLFVLPDQVGIPVALLSMVAMAAAYLPMVRWYSLPTAWTMTLPLAAVLYLGMTWMSAIAYWRGTRARWKDRAYAAD